MGPAGRNKNINLPMCSVAHIHNLISVGFMWNWQRQALAHQVKQNRKTPTYS